MTDKKSKYGSGMKNTYKQFDELTIDDSPKDMAMSSHIEGKGLMHRLKFKNLGAGMNEFYGNNKSRYMCKSFSNDRCFTYIFF